MLINAMVNIKTAIKNVENPQNKKLELCLITLIDALTVMLFDCSDLQLRDRQTTYMKREILKINKNGETLTITKSASETNGQLTEFDGTDEPGIGPPMHVHFKQEEQVKVVKGKMRVRTMTREFSLTEGEEYVFAPGEAHQFWNEGDQTLHYSGHVTPSNNYEYFIRHIYQSANEANDDKPNPFDAAFLLTKYKSEMDMLVIPKPVKIIVFPILLAIGKLTGKFKKFADAPAAVK